MLPERLQDESVQLQWLLPCRAPLFGVLWGGQREGRRGSIMDGAGVEGLRGWRYWATGPSVVAKHLQLDTEGWGTTDY